MKSLIAFALLGAAACLHAQTPNTVNVVTPTACITSIDGTPISGGTLTVFAPGQNQQAAPFTSTTGLVVSGTATRPISGGQIVGSLVLPNPAVTSPVNVGYTFTITSSSSSAKTTYASVFISPDGSGNWNLCSLQAGNYQTAFPTVFTGSSFQGGNVPNATSFLSTVTGLTPGTSDNSTKFATTAYTRAFIASLNYVGQTGSFTTGHCLEVASTSPLVLQDVGAACGSGGGITISNVVFTPTDAASIVATWTTSGAADSFAYCGGQGAVDNGMYVGQTSHKVIISGLIAGSSYRCYVTSSGVSSTPQNVVTLSAATRTPILSATMGSVTTTSYVGDSTYNFLSSDGTTYMMMDDASTPGTSSSVLLTNIANEATLALSLTNALGSYGTSGATNGTDGPGGVPLSYKGSGLFGMNGCLYMFTQRDLYSSGGTVPQTVYFGNVIADNCNHGATWNNHQSPATFNANGSPDGPGVSMFPDTTNLAWCSFVRYAADDGTNGYLTAGNRIDGANAYVYANCTDGQWNNSSHLWMVRTPRASFANLTAGNSWQYWCGPSSPTPTDFVNPANWSYASACKVSIYSAANQVSASDEVFVPGFNYYVLETWYQTVTNAASETKWNFLAGPTPAGPWTSIYTNTFNPAGWYNPSFLHRPIANNTSASSVTANVVFSGNYQSPATYYHPSYAAMTLAAVPLTETVGSLLTPSFDFSGQYLGIYNGQFAASGHLQAFTVQTFSLTPGPVDIGVCTDDGGGNFTITNYVTVNLASTTSQQTFSAPSDFTSFPVSPGQYPCFYAPAGNGLGKASGGPGLYFSNTSHGSIPVGPTPVTYIGASIVMTETISIP